MHCVKMLVDSNNSETFPSSATTTTTSTGHGHGSLINTSNTNSITISNSNVSSSLITANISSNNSNSSNPDRPSNVSLLANKYLLFDSGPTSSTNTKSNSCIVKNFQRCIKIETKEQFSCKMVVRNQEGLQLIAGYHRLDESCDSISKVHEVILSPKSFFLIMPASYGNVHAYLLAKKKLREPEAANIFRQMVTAVQFCHSKGIVLRDLKMGKFVFHDKERTIVRLDTLEDSVLLNDLSDDGLSDKHGCPNYVSPEKAEILRTNKKYPGKATDMWGLGVILYTLLAGRYPFNDEDHSKLFVKIRRGSYAIPENLSGPAKFLIRCLLQKNPSARPSCGEILQYSWMHPGGQQGSGGNSSVNCSRNPSISHSSLNHGSISSMPLSLRTNNINSNNNSNSQIQENLSSYNMNPLSSLSVSASAVVTNLNNQGATNITPSNLSSFTSYINDSELQSTHLDSFANAKQCIPKRREDEDQVVPNIDVFVN